MVLDLELSAAERNPGLHDANCRAPGRNPANPIQYRNRSGGIRPGARHLDSFRPGWCGRHLPDTGLGRGTAEPSDDSEGRGAGRLQGRRIPLRPVASRRESGGAYGGGGRYRCQRHPDRARYRLQGGEVAVAATVACLGVPEAGARHSTARAPELSPQPRTDEARAGRVVRAVRTGLRQVHC
ncbi:hypothetical protein D9M69_526220 [compost metagenome]